MNDNGKDDVIEIFEPGEEDDELYSMLDDDRRAELDELVGLQVAGLELWKPHWATRMPTSGDTGERARSSMSICSSRAGWRLSCTLRPCSPPRQRPGRRARRHLRDRGQAVRR